MVTGLPLLNCNVEHLSNSYEPPKELLNYPVIVVCRNIFQTYRELVKLLFEISLYLFLSVKFIVQS